MYNVNHKKRKLVHHTNIFKKEVVVLKPVKVNAHITPAVVKISLAITLNF